MDPKGDRLRKIKMGTLKLPESVLRSNNIVLTPEPPKLGGGCLEGGARPRPIPVMPPDLPPQVEKKPLIIGSDGSLKDMDMSGIPLPNDADIPLPKDLVPETDIPLPKPLSSENIPLPKDSDIPLPPDELIPLPADPPQQPERKKKVTLTRLEPTGDELLCRSCDMKFLKQVEYDTHLQTESHQQAIETDLKEGRSHGTGLLVPRQNKKSPSHDIKSGHVSFSFKKNIGSRITNTQPFHQRNNERVSPEIKILKLEGESPTDLKLETIAKDMGNIGPTETEKVLGSIKSVEGKESKLLCSFVKVQSKDDTGRVLDWPKEMIQYTQTEPKITYSCNPLFFDFSQLFGLKSKKSPARASPLNEKEGEGTDKLGSDVLQTDGTNEINVDKKADGEKKKSHKKKKKKKHKKHKDKSEKEAVDGAENKEASTENKVTDGDNKPEVTEGETATSKKKKKKKHKKKEKDSSVVKEGEEDKEKTGEDGQDKEKKKHKKSKKRKHQSEAEDENKTGGEEEKKSKKRKKSKKSKKRKRKHHSDKENEKTDAEVEKKEEIKKTGENTDTSADESDGEKEKDEKRKQKKKKRKSKKKEEGNESSDEESDIVPPAKPENIDKVNVKVINNISTKKKLSHDSDTENNKMVAKLQAIKGPKPNVLPSVNPVANPALIKRVKQEIVDKKTTLVDRKRVNSESSVSESTPSSNVKKAKVTPKAFSGLKDNANATAAAPAAAAVTTQVKVEKEDSWVKIENQTTDNVKSKWDTSDSDMENALDETVRTKKKINQVANVQRKPVQTKKELKNPNPKPQMKTTETDVKKTVNASLSQRSNKSNVSAGSAKKAVTSAKSKKHSHSPASSRSSRSRSRSYSHRRSYSRSSTRSRSYSYSSSSSYSSGYSHSRHRRRHSSSYSRSSSRSRSRSYHRGRGRSSSYSSYSRSYSSSRSRSRSHRRRKRRRSYSKSYSSSSYSSRSRSRSRSYRRKSRRKARRRSKQHKNVSATANEKETVVKAKAATEKEVAKETKDSNVDPSNIPLPDLSGKKEDEKSEEKLAKLKEKKPRTDVGQTVAKLVESLPSDIPLPFSENASKTVSSDALPSSPPTTATKESESGFIGPKLPNSNMAPPPPPPPGHLRFPNHGPPGPPRPGFRPNWDHWGPGPWDGPGHWEGHGPHGPGPGPRPYRGMRPPFDPRMAGPYDPRMRRPPPYMNRHAPMHMGPRYPGPHGHPHEYEYDYEYEYPPEYDSQYAEDELPKKESPPPLPPPKAPSPKPPPPEKKEKEVKEPEQNPNIVIPPEQAEQYKHLQKQAAKHARRQRRRQQKKELGEPEEDSTSSESEPEQSEVQAEVVEEEQQVILEEGLQPQILAVPQQVVLAQPQPASSPAGYVVAVSGGQQILLQKQPTLVQAGIPVQAGQPVIVSQGANAAMLAAAASGAQPAHIVQQVPSGLAGVPAGGVLAHSAAHIPQGIQVLHSSSQLQQLQQIQHIQQIQQAQQIQQIQQAQAIQAHNQAVAAAHAAQHAGHIIVGNQILVPRIGVRPAL